MKRVLITGSNSYIGNNVKKWLQKNLKAYEVDEVDLVEKCWINRDFSQYDVVYHVAGIAHADVGKVSEEQKKLYYEVNTELAIKVAEKAKQEGVKQFIFMSSMIVYSGCKEKMITRHTVPIPLNFYGDSKWKADQKIRELESPKFKVVVLRPPMVYGKDSKGNYPVLARLACKLPLFPVVKNRRSMLYIDNLCEFVKLMIDNEENGVFFPQNSEYTVTSDLVKMIADVKKHKIIMIFGFDWLVRLMMKVPGRIGELTQKAFDDMAYELKMSEYKEKYQIVDLRESVRRTET